MGSLASRPKVPKITQPQVVYMPAPTVPVASVSDSGAGEAQTQTDQAEIRKQNLLTRSRGRFGTVTTSFRGLLNSVTSGASNQSKTLLGE